MLANTDLIIISADQDEESLAKAWFYVPRMMHAQTLVYREQFVGGAEADESGKPPAKTLRLVPRQEIDDLARPQTRRRAA